MKSFKNLLKKAWANTAVRNLGNLVASVVISTVLIRNGVPPQQATDIGRATGAVILGQ